ncbi:hypothetical protein ACFL2Q_01375 [Thermodesulfobacteriota bacterium]
MSEDKPKWTMEKVHQEVSEARTKIFVVNKVLETGSLKPEENPEWVLVIKPLLKDLKEFSASIDDLMKDDYVREDKE